MNASHTSLYTNDLTSDVFSQLDSSPFTEQQLSHFNEQALQLVKDQRAYCSAHPPIAIYRVATEGSQTRNGGTIKKTASEFEFRLADGSQVRGAHKGDYVEYADGTQALIMTGSGEGNSDFALVGSHLSNGDQIVNTLQDSLLFVERHGVPLAEDFLPTIE
ncbi:hypothetical protein GIV23_14425 [Pseudomonas sp. PA-1-2A]|uniref:PAAR domain-containing protein n=1 Tax=Pseudomonas cedrina TaxID=651740 RepID=A0A2S9DLE7_PSECE|nr:MULTISPECIES: hypothetical protein [Pseudomonas]AVJ25512.1 hypothetical protein CLM72_11305 [Pseudomonas sp. MYb193]MCF5693342.1 hypothetical protein [Pseudomonas sp. PA-1-8C]MCF5786149.1 hypothetical protein [Pseudomonas sp. PA-1-6G]MCF5791819.1 hypothetical protein [Pseudomonas sp. PA-1-6B]MCF5798362.1 hypothetical protein [Pseudomonas sp. PA-1-5A]